MNTQDVFLISSEAEISRLSRLMNKSSKAFWALKDRTTPYAKSLYSCYLMNKRAMDVICELRNLYAQGKVCPEITE